MPKKAAAFPKARRFAVVRMDPVAMVEHLQDPLATNAARAMRSKKYLVYLEFPQDLPMPDSEFCRYRVNAVATRLRPPVLEKGITRDMVVPIHPNTCHARDGMKISPSPTFPFSNCYFWIDSRMSLRVRASRNRGYDNDRAYQLGIPEHVALSDAFEHDFARINRFWRQKHNVDAEELVVNPRNTFFSAVSSSLCLGESALFDESDSSPDLSPERDSAPSAPPSIPPSITDLLSMNLFGWDEDSSFQFIPLVDLWLELEEHLSEDSIPNPVGLWKEQERVGLIIKDSLERYKRTQLQHGITAWSNVDYELPSDELDHGRATKPRFGKRNGRRQSQERPSQAINESVPTRPAPAPQCAPAFTLTNDYRSWSGGIHHSERIRFSAPLSKSAEIERKDLSPLDVPVPVRPAKAHPSAFLEPAPTYHSSDANATPMTPPPSYASLFKDVGAPAPRPSQGSRAAVWPSRHHSLVFLTAAAPTSAHQHRSAPTFLTPSDRRLIAETLRSEHHYMARPQRRSHFIHSQQRVPAPSSQSSSRPHMVLHSYSYSYVQETVIMSSARNHDVWASPEDGWLPVRERAVAPPRSATKGHSNSGRTANPSNTVPRQVEMVQPSRDMRQVRELARSAGSRSRRS